uniref:Uncharacterized protein n=1 Tax=Angiostrongylus cantonensis TaxID=6313 RepID=A0A0K0CTS3_ANGCA
MMAINSQYERNRNRGHKHTDTNTWRIRADKIELTSIESVEYSGDEVLSDRRIPRLISTPQRKELVTHDISQYRSPNKCALCFWPKQTRNSKVKIFDALVNFSMPEVKLYELSLRKERRFLTPGIKLVS